MRLYICGISDKGGPSREPVRGGWYADDASGHAAAEAFAQRENKPGRSVYDAINLFHDGADRRNISTVAALTCLHADVDLKDVVEAKDAVLKRICAMPCPPSKIVDSGHGFHIYYEFKEPIPVEDAEAATARELRTQLTKYLSADPQVNQDAALMRRPGTTNSKVPAHPVPCTVVVDTSRLYDVDEFEELAELFSRPPILHRKPKEGNGHDAVGEEYSGPVDVNAELAELEPGGINRKHCRIIGSMLTAGVPYDEIVGIVATSTMEMAERHGFTTKGDRESKIWTTEKEFELVRKCLKNLVEGRANRGNREELIPAPSWVQEDLAETFETLVQEGKRIVLIHRHDTGWYLRAAYGEQREGNGHTEEPSSGASEEPGPATPSWPTPYSGRPAASIPTRKRLHGAHYLRGGVTLTAAPGGTGKSQNSLVEAVGMAAGYNLIADEPCEQLRVWVWNAEDDVDEMERRICGICDHYGVSREGLREWLFIDSGETIPLEFASDSGRIVIKDTAIATVANRVKELALDVVIFDPLVAIHALQEGDNPSLAKVIRALRNKVAKACGCAIDLVHHTRKPSKESSNALTADDIRGASSIVYSVRSARILSPMMAAEAEKYAIEGEDRHRFFRVELAKSNTARRGTLHWIELVERPIANGDNGAYGDTVTVCTKWMPPDAMAKVTDAVAAAIRSEIAKGEYRREPRAGSSWAGLLVGRRMGLDMDKPTCRRQAGDILSWLIKKGVLATEFRNDAKRRAREYVIPGSPVV
jgi:hypothetical protein